MTTLKKLGKNKFKVVSEKHGVITGTKEQVWPVMAFDMKLHSGDVGHAFKEMEKNDHHSAFFGSLGCFVFSK